MRRLHLKLFYLRTRIKREAQGVTAKTLGVRPATMSHLEQGRSQPTLPMLLALCKHYDVTPTYLLDDERPIKPGSRDRWAERDGVVARGDWMEVPEGAMVTTHDGVRLVAVQAGARSYDSSAQAQRMTCPTPVAAKEFEAELAKGKTEGDTELESTLMRELMAQRKPRNKPVAKSSSVLNNAIAQ
ncbi:MAG: helix-turn-helix domain-containing protein [Planctomycetota bacterium]